MTGNDTGKQFEKDFKDSALLYPDIYIERFKDSSFHGKIETVRVAQNPCDYIMYKHPNLFLLEMKSTKSTSFSFSDKIIKQHQIDSLIKASEINGVKAGFLFNFREREFKKFPFIKENSVYYVPIEKFLNFRKKTTKTSINEDDCKLLGYQLKQRKKKIHFEYDIYDMIEKITQQI